MAEYNFWDDRTYYTCDENWCPIACNYCTGSKHCDYCHHMYLFEDSLKKDEKAKMWTTSDILHYTQLQCADDCNCKWNECFDCASYNALNFPQCSIMRQISIKMISDHLY